MKLYIYDEDTLDIVDTFEGGTNDDCEKQASIYGIDGYGWTYDLNGLTHEQENK